jgi:putative hemolysin
LEPEHIIKLFFFIFFLILSAFFSSAETAFTAINRIKLRSIVKQNLSGAKILEKLLKNPKKLLTGILIGNNIANVAASAMATTVLIDILLSVGVKSFAVAMTIVTAIMTFLLLTFGEITPKTMAMKDPAKWALKIARYTYYSYILLYPLIGFFNLISIGISKAFRISTEVGQLLSEEEIKAIIQLGLEDGILDKEEKDMLHGVFNVTEKVVREIMTPRTDAVCIDTDSKIDDILTIIEEKGHSRIPLYEEKIDNIVGIIYAKDLLPIKEQHRDAIQLKSIARPAVFIPETKNIEELLQQMKSAKFHLAIVVDEHGGMAGLVTFEDIIEEIVGEVQDEYDKEELELQKISPNNYLIDAGMNIDDLEQEIGETFPESDEFDTVGVFILNEVGSLPIVGLKIHYKHMTFIVKEVKKRRILKVELSIDVDKKKKDTESELLNN